jgi:hypothetical protein
MMRRLPAAAPAMRRKGPSWGPRLFAVLAAAVIGTTATLHSDTTRIATAEMPAAVPFGVGEQARYRVSYNVVGRVGTGVMNIIGVDTIRGRPAYHAVFTLQGRFLLARVDNRFDSWIDTERIFSHRYEEQKREVNFRRRRARDFYPDEMRWRGHTNDRPEEGVLPTAEPLNEIAFLYFVRTQPLEVGAEYILERYWSEAGNPVRLRVLRRERVTVPAGTFNTIVVQPIIRTSGLFAEDGHAEVYFAEDDPRQLVMLRARVSFGTLQLQLEEFRSAPRQEFRSAPR